MDRDRKLYEVRKAPFGGGDYELVFVGSLEQNTNVSRGM